LLPVILCQFFTVEIGSLSSPYFFVAADWMSGWQHVGPEKSSGLPKRLLTANWPL
jgi:hypothetical protein